MYSYLEKPQSEYFAQIRSIASGRDNLNLGWIDWTGGICVQQLPQTSTNLIHCRSWGSLQYKSNTGPLYQRELVDISIITPYISRWIMTPYNQDMNQGWLWRWFRRDGLHKNLPPWGVHLQKWTLYSGLSNLHTQLNLSFGLKYSPWYQISSPVKETKDKGNFNLRVNLKSTLEGRQAGYMLHCCLTLIGCHY